MPAKKESVDTQIKKRETRRKVIFTILPIIDTNVGKMLKEKGKDFSWLCDTINMKPETLRRKMEGQSNMTVADTLLIAEALETEIPDLYKKRSAGKK